MVHLDKICDDELLVTLDIPLPDADTLPYVRRAALALLGLSDDAGISADAFICGQKTLVFVHLRPAPAAGCDGMVHRRIQTS